MDSTIAFIERNLRYLSSAGLECWHDLIVPILDGKCDEDGMPYSKREVEGMLDRLADEINEGKSRRYYRDRDGSVYAEREEMEKRKAQAEMEAMARYKEESEEVEIVYKDGTVRKEKRKKTAPVAPAPVKNYEKVKNTTPVVLKNKVNFSTSQGNMNHPIRDQLFSQSQTSIRKYEELIFAHVQELEERYPQYEDFYYEFESDSSGSWYNLMGKGK